MKRAFSTSALCATASGRPTGPAIGFSGIDFLSFEPEEFVDVTFGPRFEVPELGLQRAFAGYII